MSTVIGVWDGHDAGVALVADGRTVFAANEERYTRRKLEVGFPTLALAEARRLANDAADIHYAVTTSDPAKCLTRIFPSLKEDYYRLRRRQSYPSSLTGLKRRFKYALTQLPPCELTRHYTRGYFARQLGVPVNRVTLVDHHEAHAATAAFAVDWDGAAAIMTLDGIGDGCSGSFWRVEHGRLTRLRQIDGAYSFGLFFEHVTTQLGMRELEDEGKVMALATLASPVPDADNPFLRWFELNVDGLPAVRCRISPRAMAAEVARVAWHWPREQVSYMAQRTLECHVPAMASALLRDTGTGNLGYAGGVASNIKVNRLIRCAEGVRRCFVAPHMGDGGLALGAAWATCARRGIAPSPLSHLYLGSPITAPELHAAIHACARAKGLSLEQKDDIVAEVARLIAAGRVVMWYQGAMELGPRALGNRSILARPDSLAVKDDINLRLKRRVWFQPFCPSMLTSEAPRLLADFRGGDENPFMTSGFLVRPDCVADLAGVVGNDRSCRPHMVDDGDDSRYAALLREIKRLTGVGAVLNTSFNLHGEPLVNTPEEAIDTWIRSGVDFLAIDNFLLAK